MNITPSSILNTREGQSLTPPLLSTAVRGSKVLIPAGTSTWFRGATRVTKRAQTITVFSESPGYIEQRHHESGLRTVKPSISWAGTGGYWVDCPVTDTIFEANGFEQEVNTRNLDAWKYYFEPVLDAGQECGVVL